MVLNVADALSAYQKSGSQSLGASTSGGEVGGSGESFGEMLKSFAGDAVSSIQDGEKAAIASTTGKADLTSVVTAIGKAELMLQTVVTIRDKVISAYQDITKTAI